MFYVEQNYVKYHKNVPRRTICMNYVKEQMFFNKNVPRGTFPAKKQGFVPRGTF